MASVTYKHKKTKQTATYAQPIRKLERSDDWERVAPNKADAKTDDKKS